MRGACNTETEVFYEVVQLAILQACMLAFSSIMQTLSVLARTLALHSVLALICKSLSLVPSLFVYHYSLVASLFVYHYSCKHRQSGKQACCAQARGQPHLQPRTHTDRHTHTYTYTCTHTYRHAHTYMYTLTGNQANKLIAREHGLLAPLVMTLKHATCPDAAQVSVLDDAEQVRGIGVNA